MSSANLLNDGKRALCDQLKTMEAASRKWRRCLLVEVEGFGRFDPHACRAAQEEFESAAESARLVYGGEVPAQGLLRG
jgi:hypothetical protein